MVDESYEDYRDRLKVEAYDLKLRLRLGPARWAAFQKYLASRTINLDETKHDDDTDKSGG